MIFVDTGAFVGRYLPGDQHHPAALAGWDLIKHRRLPCWTSNLVVSETITLLARRAGYAFAAQKARLIYSSSILQVLRPNADDEAAALDWLEKFADQEVSFTDCLSFSLMRRHKLRQAFTFDRHFNLAGFENLR